MSGGPQYLNDGSIFSDNSSLFLRGGALSNGSDAPALPRPNGIWQYNIARDQWSHITTHRDHGDRIHTGRGYHLGGAKTPKSHAAFLALPGATRYMVEGLLSFNKNSLAVQNSSWSGLNHAGTEAGGFLVLLESLGQNGVLVTFGGFSDAHGVSMTIGDEKRHDPSLHRDFSSISVYDVAHNQWFRQNATGEIPPWR